jgi:hypothetical protein
MSYVLDDTKVRADRAAALSFKIMPSSVFGNRMPKAPTCDKKIARIPHDLSQSKPPPSQVGGFGQYIARSTFTTLPTTPFDKWIKADPKNQFKAPSVGVLGVATNSPEEISPKNKFMTRVKSIIDTLKLVKPDSADLVWLGGLYLVLQTRMPNSSEIRMVEDLEKTTEPMLRAIAAQRITGPVQNIADDTRIIAEETEQASQLAQQAAAKAVFTPEDEAKLKFLRGERVKKEAVLQEIADRHEAKKYANDARVSANAAHTTAQEAEEANQKATAASKKTHLIVLAKTALTAIEKSSGHQLSRENSKKVMTHVQFDSLKAAMNILPNASMTHDSLKIFLKRY